MGIRITLNEQHLNAWKRLLLYWLVFVAIMLVAGWHLRPRLDEFLTVLALPLIVIVPYGAFCLIAAAIRLSWPVRLHGLRSRSLGHRWRLLPNKGLRKRP